jgi:hypothetical protein
VKDIFAAYSGKFNNPGDRKTFMRASEFFALVENLNVIEKPGQGSNEDTVGNIQQNEMKKKLQTNLLADKLKEFFQ